MLPCSEGHFQRRTVRSPLALVCALMLVVVACGPDKETTLPIEEVTPTTEAEIVALTFDGTACHYQGPAKVEEGTVDFVFANESSEHFAVSAISVSESQLEALLSEGDVGSDWDIPFGHPRGGGIEYHNRWPPVPPGEFAEYSWTLTAGTYYLDCVLELDHVWRVARLEVSSPDNVAAPSTTQPMHHVGGDLLLAMRPGTMLRAEAEMVLGVNYQTLGIGAEEGTATHVATGVGQHGFAEVVTFLPAGGAFLDEGPGFCVAFLPDRVSCGDPPAESSIYEWRESSSGAFGTAGTSEAVFTTESGRTAAVLAGDGWAYAAWPQEWGPLLTVDFYDAAGLLITSLVNPDTVE